MYYIRQTLHSSLEEGLGTRLGLPKLFLVYWLGLSIAVRVRVRVRGRGREWIFHCFFPPCLKVTNTFVLPSWPGAWSDSYLASVCVNQWAWHSGVLDFV